MNAVPLSHSRIAETLGRLEYFQGVAPDTLQQLAMGTRQIILRRDEPVFHKGMPADALHVVVTGQVKVFLPQVSLGEKVVALVERGESFGVATVWLGGLHLADAMANRDSHLLRIDRHVLLRLARQDCALAGRLLDAVSRRVTQLMHNLESCMPRSARQRVACYLAQRRPPDAGAAYEVLLPTTKREVATKLNLTPETFSRVLHELQDAGVISIRGRGIRVLSGERLVAMKPDA